MTTTAVRDLAWCRAAFRDLDAPAPTSSPFAATPRRSWDTGAIGPGPGSTPLPDTAGVVDRVVAASGLPARRVDTVGALLLVWDEVTRLGAELLREDQEAVRALLAVRERWDLEESMLWRVLDHHGRVGAVARRELERRLYAEGALEQLLLAAVADGRLRRY